MSKKYAGLHIYSSNKSEVLSAINDIIIKQKKENNKNAYEAINVFKNPDIRNKLKRLYELEFAESKTIIVLSEKFISIYDDDFSFETVNNIAKRFSKKVNSPIIYVANFLDLVFLIGVVKNGRTLAKRNMGDFLEEYGFVAKSTIKKFHSIEEFTSYSESYEFETSQDIEVCELSIEKTFNISTNLTIEEIIDNADNFQLVDENLTFSVYKRLAT